MSLKPNRNFHTKQTRKQTERIDISEFIPRTAATFEKSYSKSRTVVGDDQETYWYARLKCMKKTRNNKVPTEVVLWTKHFFLKKKGPLKSIGIDDWIESVVWGRTQEFFKTMEMIKRLRKYTKDTNFRAKVIQSVLFTNNKTLGFWPKWIDTLAFSLQTCWETEYKFDLYIYLLKTHWWQPRDNEARYELSDPGETRIMGSRSRWRCRALTAPTCSPIHKDTYGSGATPDMNRLKTWLEELHQIG